MVTIRERADNVMSAIGYTSELTLDASKPTAHLYKLLDESILHAFGWRPQIPLKKGIESAYAGSKNMSLMRAFKIPVVNRFTLCALKLEQKV
ncbi:MAG: hypothetical protein M3O26_00325 [Pseudomonadota bacterium]|nr:hypothetical protein [Pseudomonadota bacterium]